jgi:hypothetical protein
LYVFNVNQLGGTLKINVLTIALIVTVFFSGFMGCSYSNTAQETGHEDYLASYYETVEIETENGEIKASVINNDTIAVTLTRWANGITDRSAREHMQEVDVHVTKDTAGGKLIIFIDVPDNTVYSAGCDVELSLPAGLYVDLITYNGQIDVDGHLNGMYLGTSNGNVFVANTAGDAEIHSSNGKIDISNTHGTYSISTSNGDIIVDNHSGDIEGQTSNGKVEADVIMPLEDGVCRFESSNGRITVAVPDSVSASVHLETSNGDINVDSDLEIVYDGGDEDEFNGHMGESQNQGEIYLKTSNGEVTLNKL